MLTELPFLRRVARPLLTKHSFWVVAAILGGFTSWERLPADSSLDLYMTFLAVLAGMSTLRTLDDDSASGTHEQIDVLPVARARIALEIAAGSLLGFLPFVLIAAGLGCLSARSWQSPWPQLVSSLPAILALPLLGTLVPLRHAMRWPVRLLWGGLLTYLFYLGTLFTEPGSRGDVTHALTRALVEIALLFTVWGLTWRLGHALGGGWSTLDAGSFSRSGSRPCAGGCPLRSRGIPDGWNPLMWRELTTGWLPLVLLLFAGTIYIGLGPLAPNRWNGPVSRVSPMIFWLITWACMASALRTSRDRLSGMWADLANTPVSQHSVLWTRVRAMTCQTIFVALSWVIVAWLCPHWQDTPRAVADLLGFALGASLAGGSGAVLAGFATGTTGRGVLAAAGGMVVLYLLAVLSWLPAGFGGWLIDRAAGYQLVRQFGYFAPAFAVVSASLIFYGTLIWYSMRGIRAAVSTQRA